MDTLSQVAMDFVIDQGVKFVTTSAGSPTRYTEPLKKAGLTVFHVVPTLKAALKAVAKQKGQSQANAIAYRIAAYSNHPQVLRPALRHARAIDHQRHPHTVLVAVLLAE